MLKASVINISSEDEVENPIIVIESDGSEDIWHVDVLGQRYAEEDSCVDKFFHCGRSAPQAPD